MPSSAAPSSRALVDPISGAGVMATYPAYSELVSWFDAGGTEWPLNGEVGYLAKTGRHGARGLMPFRRTEQQVPLFPGATLRYVLPDVRVVDLPTLIAGASPDDFVARYRALALALDPTAGDGQLQVTRADGTSRTLACRYESGLEGDEADVTAGASYEVAALAFRAVDPYWYDVAATQISFGVGSPVPFFNNGGNFFPLNISKSGIYSGFTVPNTGDDACWPTWIIQGPATNPTLTNNTTGKSLALTIALGASDVLTIVTAPGTRTITKQDGSNQYGALSFGSSLWPLARGVNNITLALTGGTSATSITLQYKQRYKTA